MSERSLRALLDPGLAAGGPAAVAATVVDTARTVFGVPNAALLELRRDLHAVAVTAGAGGPAAVADRSLRAPVGPRADHGRDRARRRRAGPRVRRGPALARQPRPRVHPA